MRRTLYCLEASFQECSSAFIATLNTEALVNYLRTHPVNGCLADFMWDFNTDLAQTFTDENMHAVFDSIAELSPDYDGTNALGLQQLWVFPMLATSTNYSKRT